MTKYLKEIEERSEQEKFRRIYEQYYRLMYQIARQILENHEDTEEALQEAFIRIARNISKIEDVNCSQTRNYVVIICKNVALSMVKKNKLPTKEWGESAFEVTDHETPEQVVTESEIVNIIVQAILGLPEAYREVLYLSLVQDWKMEEIADAMYLKKETVKKRLYRGKKILKQRLRERGVTYEG